MRVTQILTLALASLILLGCGRPMANEADREALQAITPRWLELSSAQDAAGIAAMFAEDGTLLRHGRTPVAGPTAVEAYLAAGFAMSGGGDDEAAASRIEIASSGDLAFEEGTWSYPPSGAEGSYVTLFRKVAGEWKIAGDISVNTSPDGGAPLWAVEFLTEWYKRSNARDARGLADLYSADARVGKARGRKAIIERFTSEWKTSNSTCTGSFDEFMVVDDTAVGWGRDTCTTPASDGGEISTETWRWLAVYQRRDDGSWICVRDIGERVGS